jgi:hypothetical protein
MPFQERFTTEDADDTEDGNDLGPFVNTRPEVPK